MAANATTTKTATASYKGSAAVAGQIESTGVQGTPVVEKPNKGSSTLKEVFYGALALVAMGGSGAAFVIEGGPIVGAVSAICAFLGPVAAIQQRKLTNIETMRELQNQLREEVNSVRLENDRLKEENEKLSESTKRLKEVESTLAEISTVQGQSVQVLVDQVEEYKKIQAEVKESLEAKVIQNLISVVISSDKDDDFILDTDEADGLITRLENVEGVDFSLDNLKKAIQKAGHDPEAAMKQKGGFDLQLVIAVIKNLLDDDVPDEENIFQIKTERLLPKSLSMRKK